MPAMACGFESRPVHSYIIPGASLMKILIASRNSHKIREIGAIIMLPSIEFMGLDQYPDMPEVIEDGATFQENAVKKALTLALATGQWTLADDSGLEVDALNGEPGVRSARYAGEPVDNAANNRKLLSDLGERTDRTARFRCAIALSSPSGRVQFVEGACEGIVLTAMRGTGGFGYDPLFQPVGHEVTFADMADAQKNRISHRAVALKRAIDAWGKFLATNPSEWYADRRLGKLRPEPE